MEILFQLLLKGCTIEAPRTSSSNWNDAEFQLLLKGCTIEATVVPNVGLVPKSFSCC